MYSVDSLVFLRDSSLGLQIRRPQVRLQRCRDRSLRSTPRLVQDNAGGDVVPLGVFRLPFGLESFPASAGAVCDTRK